MDDVGSVKLMRGIAPRTPLRLRFEAFAELANGLAARHRLDFSEAKRRLRSALGRFRPMFKSREDSPLKLTGDALAICEACSESSANATLLRELLDNAICTAAQGRYEDAAARLYRAMEMQGQLWLAEATGGVFINGRCKKDNAAAIPPALRTLSFCQPDEAGEIRLSLEELFLALAALSHERAG